MKRFEGVRMHGGIGWVDPVSGTVAKPPDEVAFGVAERPTPESIALYVVETPRIVAILSNGKRSFDDAIEERAAHALHRAGFPLAVWCGPDAEGAALAHVFDAANHPIEDVACGLWVWKRGGWDESAVMTFRITRVTLAADDRTIRRVTSVNVRHDGDGAIAELARPGKWDIVEHARAPAVILVDVDQTMAFNDAYGHEEGDLMIARVEACVTRAAVTANAEVVRVAGEELAVLVDGDADALARSIEHDVEALAIPFVHPTVKTTGQVTVTCAIAPGDATDLRRQLEARIDEAKQRRSILVRSRD